MAKPFYEAFEDIMEAVEIVLKNAQSNELSGIREIVRGDRIEDDEEDLKVEPPALWLFPAPAYCEEKFSVNETWTLPLGLIMITENQKRIYGRKQSGILLNKARNVLLKNKRLGIPGTVQDVQSDTVDFYPEIDQTMYLNKTQHPTFAILNVKFRVDEGEES